MTHANFNDFLRYLGAVREGCGRNDQVIIYIVQRG